MLLFPSLIEILANPPRLIQYLKSEKRCKSPIGTKGAPCPLREISKLLKLLIVVVLVFLEIVFPQPICRVYLCSGS